MTLHACQAHHANNRMLSLYLMAEVVEDMQELLRSGQKYPCSKRSFISRLLVHCSHAPGFRWFQNGTLHTSDNA